MHSNFSPISDSWKMIKSYWKEKTGYDINIENLLFANLSQIVFYIFKKNLLMDVVR